MKQLAKDLLYLFPRKAFIKFGFLLGLILSASLIEAIGVGVIPLYIAILINPSKLVENKWIGFLFKDMPDEANIELIIWASAILLCFVIVKGIFLSFVYYMQAKTVNNESVTLRSYMFKLYQKAPYDWTLQRSSSETLRNIQQDTQQIITGIINPILDLFMGVSMCLLVAVVMVIAAPTQTFLGVLIIGLGIAFTLRIFQKSLRKTGDVLRLESKEMIQAIQQGFGALVDARITDSEAYLAEKFHSSAEKQAKASTLRGTLMKSTPVIIEALAVFGLLFIFILLIKSTENIDEVVPTFSLIGVAVVRLKAQAARIAAATNMINASKAYVPGLVKDIKEIERLEKEQPAQKEYTKVLEVFESLELRNISYSYPNAETQALKSISLELNKGESIAFVGETGCGKSTLVNVIIGLLHPQGGEIKVNGIDVRAHELQWHKKLGYIPQSVFLINETIRANISFGVDPTDVNERKLREVIEATCLTKFVNDLPEGLDTVVGERGVRLSGGQRQRLGIARALYFDPEVLVMDEATSALDDQTEKLVMQAIENAKTSRAMIMIAHRLSTIQKCDRVYSFKAGEVKLEEVHQQVGIAEGFQSVEASNTKKGS